MPEVVVPLTVRGLAAEDLQVLARTESATSLAHIANALERARLGEVDFLAVCPPSDLPVATGGVDFTKSPGAGTLWKLSVDEALRSCGVGTILVRALEQRISARGLRRAELGVDERMPRPRALYERLGYLAYGRESGGWDQEAPDGSVIRYETMITLMCKELPRADA